MSQSQQMAEKILALPASERAEALSLLDTETNVPLVSFYIRDHEHRAMNLVAYVICGDTRAERNRRIASVPEAVRKEVKARAVEIFEKRKAGKV